MKKLFLVAALLGGIVSSASAEGDSLTKEYHYLKAAATGSTLSALAGGGLMMAGKATLGAQVAFGGTALSLLGGLIVSSAPTIVVVGATAIPAGAVLVIAKLALWASKSK